MSKQKAMLSEYYRLSEICIGILRKKLRKTADILAHIKFSKNFDKVENMLNGF